MDGRLYNGKTSSRRSFVFCIFTIYLFQLFLPSFGQDVHISSISIIDITNGAELLRVDSLSANLILSRLPAINIQANVEHLSEASNITILFGPVFSNISNNQTTILPEEYDSTAPYLYGCCSNSLPYQPVLLKEGSYHFMLVAIDNNTSETLSQFNTTLVIKMSENSTSNNALPQNPPDWQIITALSEQSMDTLYRYLRVFAEVSKEVYIPSMYYSYTAPQGWERIIDIQRNPTNGGIHALVYKDHNYQTTKRVVIAFRGTQDIYDQCVNAVFWPNLVTENATKMEFCKQVPPSNLDYIGQGVALVQEVLQRYHDAKILLTGHSLGSSVASLVALRMSLPVVTFGGPGVKSLLPSTTTNSQLQWVHNFYDVNDPVEFHTDSLQVGHLCGWQTPTTSACSACNQDHNGTLDSQNCNICFTEAHLFGHYMSLVGNTSSNRIPITCEFRSIVEQTTTTTTTGTVIDPHSPHQYLFSFRFIVAILVVMLVLFTSVTILLMWRAKRGAGGIRNKYSIQKNSFLW